MYLCHKATFGPWQLDESSLAKMAKTSDWVLLGCGEGRCRESAARARASGLQHLFYLRNTEIAVALVCRLEARGSNGSEMGFCGLGLECWIHGRRCATSDQTKGRRFHLIRQAMI